MNKQEKYLLFLNYSFIGTKLRKGYKNKINSRHYFGHELPNPLKTFLSNLTNALSINRVS
jgi:hypothetical protein